MNGRLVSVAVVTLALGFVAGYLVRGPGQAAGPGNPGKPPMPGMPATPLVAGTASEQAADARAALDELLTYRGMGATATRHVIGLIGRIGAGGEELLPDLAAAIRTGENYDYSTAGYSIDARGGEVSVHPDRRNALIEAVYRIGGDESIRILIETANRSPSWIHRISALAYLGQYSDRADVRKLFLELLRKLVVTHHDDGETVQYMDTVRGRLDPEAMPLLIEGVSGGWAGPELSDLFVRAMIDLDEKETVRVLVQLVADTTKAIPARAVAAHALAQMPEHRPVVLRLVLDSGSTTIIETFMAGLRFGRLDYVEQSRAAGASRDRPFILAYNRDRLRDMEDAYAILAEIRENLTEDQAQAVKLQGYLEMFEKSIKDARQAVRQMEAAGGD